MKIINNLNFPKAEETARAKNIENNYSLFLGEYNKILKFLGEVAEKNKYYQDKSVKNKIEVVLNYTRLISRNFADLMFLENPQIKVEDEKAQQELDDFLDRANGSGNFYDLLYKSAITQSYAGFTCFEAYKEDNEVKVQEIIPSRVFPQFANGKDTPEEIIISWIVNIPENNRDKFYYFMRKHTVGLIKYELYSIKANGSIGEKVSIKKYSEDLPEEEKTGLDIMPVWFVNNYSTSRDFFGYSDYEDIKSPIKELCRSLSQIATQLEKHANAKIAVPVGTLDENGEVQNKNMEVFEVDSMENGNFMIPEYIEPKNPLIEQAFKNINLMNEAIARLSQQDKMSFGLDAKGGAEKVGALLLRMYPMLIATKRKLKGYTNFIKTFLSFAMQWEGVEIQKKDISISYHNGLPQDVLEQTTIEAERIKYGIQTKGDAIRNLDKISGDALTNKLEEIKLEAQQEQSAIFGTPQIKL